MGGGVGVGGWGFGSFNNEGGWGGSFKMFDDLPRCPVKGFYPIFNFENFSNFQLFTDVRWDVVGWGENIFKQMKMEMKMSIEQGRAWEATWQLT